MKRKILAWLLFLSLVFPAVSFAVDASATLGTVERFKNISGQYNRVVIPIVFTANSGTAAMATYTLDPSDHNISGWYLWRIVSDPGSTGPSNGAWDLDISDAQSLLVSRNLHDDKSSTLTQETIFSSQTYPLLFPMIVNTWSITIGDNSVNSAVVTIYLTFVDRLF